MAGIEVTEGLPLRVVVAGLTTVLLGGEYHLVVDDDGCGWVTQPPLDTGRV